MKPVLVVTLLVLGCHPWSPTEIPTPDRGLAGNPREARVVLIDGTAVVLKKPFIRADTLFGSINTAIGDARFEIPITRIKTFEVPRFSGDATAILLAAVGGLVVIVVYLYLAFQNW